MNAEELRYSNLKPVLAPFEKGRGESIAFLSWFLENILRLDEVTADDAICDRPNDRGIDGIYVDHTLEEILVLQGKLKQRESSIGDASLRDLAGTLTQLEDSESVQALIDGGANEELKRILARHNVKDLVSKGYTVVGLFISNQPLDSNGKEFLDSHKALSVYDRHRIASEFINIEQDGGVSGSYYFDTSYVSPMVIKIGDYATTYVLPVQARELVGMNGIDDGTLFSQNVRQSLGNTKVNKALRSSVLESTEHDNFLLYHNGVNILCRSASLDEASEKLEIKDYVVVNGAQSITTFRRSQSSLTSELRVLAKIIQIDDSGLSKKITINSNNQNAIKPRDLKSTNEIQLRLRKEFSKIENGRYDLEIKRGQEIDQEKIVVTNEEAGRLLLAFDLMSPESCHQVYKVFDDRYAEIFARPAVNAYRIIFLHLLMQEIQTVVDKINYKPLAKYGLTRFFLLSVVAEIVRSSEATVKYYQDPSSLFSSGNVLKLMNAVENILASIVIDLNYEVEDLGKEFDYKGDLKSPLKTKALRSKLLRSYEKDISRGKASSITQLMA